MDGEGCGGGRIPALHVSRGSRSFCSRENGHALVCVASVDLDDDVRASNREQPLESEGKVGTQQSRKNVDVLKLFCYFGVLHGWVIRPVSTQDRTDALLAAG